MPQLSVTLTEPWVALQLIDKTTLHKQTKSLHLKTPRHPHHPRGGARHFEIVNRELFTGTVPVNKKLLTGTVPVNNSVHKY